MNKDTFVQAIHERRKVRLTFVSQKANGLLTRLCAPLDYGPSRHAKDNADRFHIWNYDADPCPHVMSVNRDQVREVELLDEHFDPVEFITWSTTTAPWFVARDWGEYS